MGVYDSSRTRVQPIFDALYKQNKTGTLWLTPLLNLARRPGERVAIPNWLDPLVEEPQYEFPANPSRSFLRWLLENPNQLAKPSQEVWDGYSPTTREKREKLFNGDQVILQEAIDELYSQDKLPERAWWRFEGVTKVDCVLRTESTLIFIEGKRTELGPSRDITWYPARNQVLRNLDCAAALAGEVYTNFYVIVIVEGKLLNEQRKMELDNIVDPQTVKTSLPHLQKEQQALILEHYLGYITWEEIIDTFGLDPGLLAN